MNIVLTSACSACVTQVFNSTLPTVYKKVNDALGSNIFNVDEDEINDEEFNDISTDSEVGYLTEDMKIAMNKKKAVVNTEAAPTTTPIDTTKDTTKNVTKDSPEIKKKKDKTIVIKKCTTMKKYPLDIIADISVGFFVIYASYKLIVVIKDTDFSLDMLDI